MLRERALDLVDALSRQYESSWATERAMRTMLEHTGQRPGERSISRVLRKASQAGTIRRVRVKPGGRLPNGQYTRHGTTLNVRISRQERRAEARKRAKARRRAARAELEAVKRPSPPPGERGGEPPAAGEEQVSLAQWLAAGNTIPDAARDILQGALSRRAMRDPPPD